MLEPSSRNVPAHALTVIFTRVFAEEGRLVKRENYFAYLILGQSIVAGNAKVEITLSSVDVKYAAASE